MTLDNEPRTESADLSSNANILGLVKSYTYRARTTLDLIFWSCVESHDHGIHSCSIPFQLPYHLQSIDHSDSDVSEIKQRGLTDGGVEVRAEDL